MCSIHVSYTQVAKDTLSINSDEIDDPIYYSAEDSIYADMRNEKIHLFGNAKIDNGEVQMNAGYIMIDINSNEVLAQYSFDEDSNMVELPEFTDGSDKITAQKLRYNFDTKKAYIEEVAIQQDEIFLHMGEAKRHSNEQIHFRKGRFTTCNLDDPHYHFQLSKAVMVPEKRIVSGPMNLWIKGVPTPLGLPFSIIPQVEDKTQGLIFPEITPISAYGFGFQNLGYYIPINQKLQTTFYATLYSRGSWGISNSTQYANRYKYQGNIDVGFQQFRSGFPSNVNQDKITVVWRHKKDPKSSPYWNFGTNINFISDNQAQNNLDPLNENYFRNTFNSDINLSRRFPGKPVTMGAKISLRQNSSTNNISLASPVVNVNVTRFFPFKKLIKGNAKGIMELFSRLGVTYNFEGQNRALFGDSLLQEGDFGGISQQFMNGMNQNIAIQTTAGFFKNTWKFTPSVNYGNKINFQRISKSLNLADTTVSVDTNQMFGMAHDLRLNASLTTVLYSYYKYVGKKKPIVRHILTPSFTFSYRPKLNTNESYTNIDGTEEEYSPFERSLYTVGATRDQALLNFGFNNTFELKRKSEKDTVDGFKRTRLIDALSIRGSYDFLDAETPLSDISINMRVSPLKWLNFVATSSFSPYGWNTLTGVDTTAYAIGVNKQLGRFKTTSLATTLTFTSKESRKKLGNAIDNIGQNWNADYEYYLLHPEEFLNFEIPWKLSLSHVYSINANTNISSTNSDRYNQIQTLMLNGDISFTKRWKVSTRTNFDLQDFKITNSRISLTRDMHCWALAFHWTPIGGNKSFLFTIRSTSTLFQDAKIELRKPPAFL
jgi:lipopolysaccharide export system protein LptA